MSDLLTPAELAAMLDRAHDLRAARFFKEADWLFALLRHIAALEDLLLEQQFPELSKLRDDTPEPEVFTVVDLGSKPSVSVEAAVEVSDTGDTTVKIGENDYADFEKVENSAPAHCQCTECKPWLNTVNPAPATDVDALLADCEREISIFERTSAENSKRLITALRESRAQRDKERAAHDAIASICHEAGVDGGDGTSISLVRALAADLAAARAELARLGPVEWEASSGNGWGHVTESTRARCQGLPGWEFRAIRVVKEAQ